MALDKSIATQHRRYAAVSRAARDRAANEANTVMYLIKFCEDLLVDDSLI